MRPRMLALLLPAGSLLFRLFLLAAVPAAHAGAPPAEGPRTFRVEVTGTGPAMILIPGLASAGAVWDETVDYYRGRYTCHVLTLAGFGGVPAQAAQPFLETVRDELAAYVRAQGLGRPVVVGHSLGGFVALWLAAAAPDVVGAVVVVDALPYLPAAQMPAATPEQMRPQAEALRAQMAGQTQETFHAYQAATLRTMIADSADVARALATGGASDPAAVGQAVYEMLTTDLREDVARIQAPVLVIGTWAGSKAYFTREQVQQVFEAQYAKLPGARLVLHDTALHFVMYDDLDGMVKEMDAFLASR